MTGTKTTDAGDAVITGRATATIGVPDAVGVGVFVAVNVGVVAGVLVGVLVAVLVAVGVIVAVAVALTIVMLPLVSVTAGSPSL